MWTDIGIRFELVEVLAPVTVEPAQLTLVSP